MVSLQIITIQIIGLYLIIVTFLVKSECDMYISHTRYYGRADNEYERDLLLFGRKRIEFITCKNLTLAEEPLFSVLLNNTNNVIHKYDEIDKELLLTALNISLVNSNVTLNSKTFENFPNLTTLNLMSNNVSSFDIAPISSVRNLDLSYNLLTTLNNTNFKNFKLSSLNASYNQLLNIYCMHVSTEINLSHNQLSDLCIFASTIEFINLSFNNITLVSYTDLIDLKNLAELDLSYNNIKYISSHLETNKLRYLNLSHNQIKYLHYHDFEGLESLISIDLSYNRIEKIEHGVTNSLQTVRYLDLSYNYIYDLDIAAAFYSMQNIRELKLEGNVLRELDVKILNNLLQKLERISISFSQISCNKLMNYMGDFKKFRVWVLKGPIVYQHNVHGILCTPSNNTSLYGNNFEYAMYSVEKIHSLFIAITLFFILILLMLIVINYYRYKNMRRF